MTYAVRYYSKTGNTKKLAEAVAEELGVEAFTTDAPLTEKVDCLFLGSSVYGAGVDEAVIKYIADNRDMIGQIVNISTAALLPSTYKQVKKLAESNGVAICDQEFHCRGSFAMMHKGHPDAQDLADAKSFVRSLMK